MYYFDSFSVEQTNQNSFPLVIVFCNTDMFLGVLAWKYIEKLHTNASSLYCCVSSNRAIKNRKIGAKFRYHQGLKNYFWTPFFISTVWKPHSFFCEDKQKWYINLTLEVNLIWIHGRLLSLPPAIRCVVIANVGWYQIGLVKFTGKKSDTLKTAHAVELLRITFYYELYGPIYLKICHARICTFRFWQSLGEKKKGCPVIFASQRLW